MNLESAIGGGFGKSELTPVENLSILLGVPKERSAHFLFQAEGNLLHLLSAGKRKWRKWEASGKEIARLDAMRRVFTQTCLHDAFERSGEDGDGKETFSSPSAVSKFLKMHLAGKDREEFGALWLDAKNSLLSIEILFSGTLDKVSIYSREVLKSALNENAGGCIFFHNHPSGDSTPSHTDVKVTQELIDVLGHAGGAGSGPFRGGKRRIVHIFHGPSLGFCLWRARSPSCLSTPIGIRPRKRGFGPSP